jgi:hypothetical protein
MFEYSGAIHMHSTYSDGSGSVEEIAKSASECDLDFYILTDHNTLKAKDKGYEGWHDGKMLIVGYELNDKKNQNHYMVLGADEVVGAFENLPNGELGSRLSAREYVKEVKENGGFGFIAHPHEERTHLPGHPAYPWTEWDTDDFDGIEIWNHMSEWAEGLTESNKVNRFLHPLRSIVAPFDVTLKKWDELNIKRKVVGIGGIDAHAHKQNIMGFFEVEIFAYKVLFKSIRTNVIIDCELQIGDEKKFKSDKKLIEDALKYGRSFIVNYYHGTGKGFRFFAEHDDLHFGMGDTVEIEKSKNKRILLKAFLPSEAKIKLIYNGNCIDERTGFDAMWDCDQKGVYRVECWKGDKGWIFSNHIRVE